MEDKNKKEENERVRARVLSLIDAEFESDAAFERTLGLGDKTVNNWRRGRSSSYMKMLPTLAECFGVSIGDLLDVPLRGETIELSEDEVRLLAVYRRARTMPKDLRMALAKTLESVIELYFKTAEEKKSAAKDKKKKTNILENEK